MNPKNAPYGWLVKRIAHRLEQNMNNFLKPYNITIMQSWVLLYLKDDKDCCTYKELDYLAFGTKGISYYRSE